MVQESKERITLRQAGLAGRTVLVSAMTLLSRLLGFAREVLMASLFGDTSVVSDAFLTAWRVPNLFRRLLGEGALSTSLQATLTEVDSESGDAAGRRLFLRTVSLAFWLLMIVCLGGMALVAWIPDDLNLAGWQVLGGGNQLLRDLTLRLLPYVVFVCLTALAGGALQVRGHYLVPSLAPALMNVTWIAALLAIGLAFGWSGGPGELLDGVDQRQWEMARWLSWGVLLGGVVQLLLHLPPLVRRGLLAGPRTLRRAGEDANARGPSDVLRMAAPLALAAAVYQINVMIDGLMAYRLLEEGGPTALYYANRIQQFPLALVALAATTAVFPLIKAHAHLGELDALRRLHDRSQLGILFLALPATLGLLALAQPISSVLFEHGQYGPAGIERVTAGLSVLAFALVPAGAAGLVGRTYIAMGDTRTPVRTSIWMMLTNMGLNLLFVKGFGMDVGGLALATVITIWGNLIWLLLAMPGKLALPKSAPGTLRQIGRVSLAALATGAGAWLASWPLSAGEGVAQLIRLGVGICAGLAAFVFTAQGLKLDQWTDFQGRLARRLGK